MTAPPITSTVGQAVATYTNRVDVAVIGHANPFMCSVKATLKKAGETVLTGDWVTVDEIDLTQQSARIIGIQPRSNQLQRPKIANVDGVLVVQSLTQPTLELEQLDRYLIHGALAGLPVAICLTKSDLLPAGSTLASDVATQYQALGYPVFTPNFHTPGDYDELQQGLVTGVSGFETRKNHPSTWVLAGVSGAGKSSLLNKLNPGLRLKEGEVGHKLERGQHTTRHVSLLAVTENLLIADTPGFSRLTFDEVDTALIPQVWPEFLACLSEASHTCTFTNCTHLDEADCGIKAAVEAGTLPEHRYHHYTLFIAEADAAKAARNDRTDKSEYGTKQLRQKGGKHTSRVRLNEKLRSQSRRQSRQALTEHTYLTVDESELDDELDV